MTNYFMVALAAFLAGAFFGGTLVFLRNKNPTRANVASTTWFLFRLFSMSAVSWVYISYAIAIYSTVKLGQVYTMAELATPAITGIIMILVSKVTENIFEHNDGPLWGKTNKDKHKEEEL